MMCVCKRGLTGHTTPKVRGICKLAVFQFRSLDLFLSLHSCYEDTWYCFVRRKLKFGEEIEKKLIFQDPSPLR